MEGKNHSLTHAHANARTYARKCTHTRTLSLSFSHTHARTHSHLFCHKSYSPPHTLLRLTHARTHAHMNAFLKQQQLSSLKKQILWQRDKRPDTQKLHFMKTQFCATQTEKMPRCIANVFKTDDISLFYLSQIVSLFPRRKKLNRVIIARLRFSHNIKLAISTSS